MLQPGELAARLGEDAAAVERLIDRETVLAAGEEVVAAVAGRGVYDAGALFQRDVVGQHDGGFALQERMLRDRAFELLAGGGVDDRVVG